jgi:hypothetical protein
LSSVADRQTTLRGFGLLFESIPLEPHGDRGARREAAVSRVTTELPSWSGEK